MTSLTRLWFRVKKGRIFFWNCLIFVEQVNEPTSSWVFLGTSPDNFERRHLVG